MQVVCARCSARNRIPDDRLHDNPVCGKCGEELMQLRPVELNDQNFQRYAEGTDLPILVDFWAEWCGPCRMMAPQFEAAAARMPGVRFVKLDTEAAPQTSIRYRIRSIPTMALFRQGQEVARTSGAMSAADIERWVNQNLGK